MQSLVELVALPACHVARVVPSNDPFKAPIHSGVLLDHTFRMSPHLGHKKDSFEFSPSHNDRLWQTVENVRLHLFLPVVVRGPATTGTKIFPGSSSRSTPSKKYVLLYCDKYHFRRKVCKRQCTVLWFFKKSRMNHLESIEPPFVCEFPTERLTRWLIETSLRKTLTTST